MFDLCQDFLRGSWDVEVEVPAVEEAEDEGVDDSAGSVLDRSMEKDAGMMEARKDLLDVMLGIMSGQQMPALHAAARCCY